MNPTDSSAALASSLQTKDALVCGDGVTTSSAVPPDSPTLDLKHDRVAGSAATSPDPRTLLPYKATGFVEVSADDVTCAAIVKRLLAQSGLDVTQELEMSAWISLRTAENVMVCALNGTWFTPDTPPSSYQFTDQLRTLAGYSAQGVPTIQEANRLADIAIGGFSSILGQSISDFFHPPEIFHCTPNSDVPDSEGQEMSCVENIADDDTSQDPSIWNSSSQADPHDPIQRLLAPLSTITAAAATPLPFDLLGLHGLLDVKLFRQLYKAGISPEVRAKARAYAKANAAAPEQSARDGQLAELVIRGLYIEQVSRDYLSLFGARIGAALSTLAELASADPDWAAVKLGLLSFFTGAFGQPDILDKKLFHVYEIKPARRAMQGLRQLYLRYLFWLNLYEIADANGSLEPINVAQWVSGLLSGNPAAPPGISNPVAPKRVWKPGTWEPPKEVRFPDKDGLIRHMTIDLVVPGVICYRLDKRPDKDPDGLPDPIKTIDQVAIMKLAMGMLAGWAGVEYGRRTGSRTPEQVAAFFAPEDVSPTGVFPGPESVDMTPVVVFAIAVLLVVVLGPEVIVAGALDEALAAIFEELGLDGILAGGGEEAGVLLLTAP